MGAHTSPVERHGVSTAPTAGDLVHHYLYTQADALVLGAGGLRKGVPDSLHPTRVAVRRLRSALSVYRSVFDASSTDPLAAELRWFGRCLGVARDAEVQTKRLTVALWPPITASADSLLREHLAGKLREGDAAVHSALYDDRHRALFRLLDGVLADPRFTDVAAQPADLALLTPIRHAGAVVRRHVDALDLAPRGGRDLAVHRMRKAATRARCAVQVAAPLWPELGVRCEAASTRFHSLVGDYQDSTVSRSVVVALACEADERGVPSFPFGRLYERASAVADRIAPALPNAWRRVEHALAGIPTPT
jgi:CHAD domain-containing protein